MSDPDDFPLESSAALADLIEAELGDDTRPATKGDVARLHAAQLRLFDYCAAVQLLAASGAKPDLQLKASYAARRLSSAFVDKTRAAIFKLNDEDPDEDAP